MGLVHDIFKRHCETRVRIFAGFCQWNPSEFQVPTRTRHAPHQTWGSSFRISLIDVALGNRLFDCLCRHMNVWVTILYLKTIWYGYNRRLQLNTNISIFGITGQHNDEKSYRLVYSLQLVQFSFFTQIHSFISGTSFK